jgi:dynactin 1
MFAFIFVIFILLKISDATTDSGLLMQFVIQNVETVKQQLKLVKRRLPQDISITKCKLSQNTMQNLKVTVEALNKIMNVLFMVSKGVLHLVTVNTGEYKI